MGAVEARVRESAALLLWAELARDAEPARLADVTHSIGRRLAPAVGRRIGGPEFQALMALAASLARQASPSLGPLAPNADGSFEGLDEVLGLEAAERRAWLCLALIERLLDLSTTLLGAEDVETMLHDAWPEVFPDSAD